MAQQKQHYDSDFRTQKYRFPVSRRLFKRSPVETMSEIQKAVYQELPISFCTAEGVGIAARYGMRERAFKDWIKIEPFKHMAHG